MSNIDTTSRVFVTVRDFKPMIGLGTTKFYELVNEGIIITIKIGRRRLVDVAPSLANMRALSNASGASPGRKSA